MDRLKDKLKYVLPSLSKITCSGLLTAAREAISNKSVLIPRTLIHVRISFLSKHKLFSSTDPAWAFFDENTNLICIKRTLNMSCKLYCLIHEMRHAQQLQTLGFPLFKKIIEYKLAYEENPLEIDAFAAEVAYGRNLGAALLRSKKEILKHSIKIAPENENI